MSEQLTPVQEMAQVVANYAKDLEFKEKCIATHDFDETSARVDDLVSTNAPQRTVELAAKDCDSAITFLDETILYWLAFGTGPDEEREWEIDNAWKQKEREERIKRVNQKRHKNNDPRDDCEL